MGVCRPSLDRLSLSSLNLELLKLWYTVATAVKPSQQTSHHVSTPPVEAVTLTMYRGDTSQPYSTPCPSLRLPSLSPPHLQEQCRSRHGDHYTLSDTIKRQCPEPTFPAAISRQVPHLAPLPGTGRCRPLRDDLWTVRQPHLKSLPVPSVSGLFALTCAHITIRLEYYYALSTWPEPIRTPLKQALKAKNRGDVDRAEISFRQYVSSSLLAPRPHHDTPLKEEWNWV